MFAKDQIIEIFFKLDEFWKKFTRFPPKCIEQTDRKKRHYHRDGKMSEPEIMLIMILFHSSGYRCLKHFYLNEVCGNMKDEFKLHLIYNVRGELLSVAFTKGNIDDRKPLEDKQFIKDIYAKLVGGWRIHIQVLIQNIIC